jgi:hypothetical protein
VLCFVNLGANRPFSHINQNVDDYRFVDDIWVAEKGVTSGKRHHFSKYWHKSPSNCAKTTPIQKQFFSESKNLEYKKIVFESAL